MNFTTVPPAMQSPLLPQNVVRRRSAAAQYFISLKENMESLSEEGSGSRLDVSHMQLATIRNKAQVNAIAAVEQLQARSRKMLDFSVESLSAIDEILTDISVQQLHPLSLERLTTIVECYVLEVFYRVHGGRFTWLETRKHYALIVGEPISSLIFTAREHVASKLLRRGELALVELYVQFSLVVSTRAPGTTEFYP